MSAAGRAQALPGSPSGSADVETVCDDPWRLSIEREGDAFTLNVHVESSLMSWDRAFPLTCAQASALAAEEARRLALHDVLHPLLQTERQRPLRQGLTAEMIEMAATAPLDGLRERLHALTSEGQAEAEGKRLLPELQAVARSLSRFVGASGSLDDAGTASEHPSRPRSRTAVGEEVRLDAEFERHEALLREIGAVHEVTLRDPRGPDWGVTRDYRWRDRLLRIDHTFEGRFAVRVTFGPATAAQPPDPMGWLALESLLEPERHPPELGAAPKEMDPETFRRRIAMLPGAMFPTDPPVSDFWKRT